MQRFYTPLSISNLMVRWLHLAAREAGMCSSLRMALCSAKILRIE